MVFCRIWAYLQYAKLGLLQAFTRVSIFETKRTYYSAIRNTLVLSSKYLCEVLPQILSIKSTLRTDFLGLCVAFLGFHLMDAFKVIKLDISVVSGGFVFWNRVN